MNYFTSLFTLICVFSFTANATSPFQQMIEKDLGLKSKESTVHIDGIEYRKIEIKDDTFYLSFKGRKSDVPSLHCGTPGGGSSEKLVEGSISIKKRKRFYFNLLKESCNTQNGQVHYTVDLDPQLGIFLPEGHNDKIKNKKLGINPMNPNALNFSGEW